MKNTGLTEPYKMQINYQPRTTNSSHILKNIWATPNPNLQEKYTNPKP